MAKKIFVLENINPKNGAELMRAYEAKLKANGMKLGSSTIENDGTGKGQMIVEAIADDLNKADNLSKDEGMLEGSNYDFESSSTPVTKKTISTIVTKG